MRGRIYEDVDSIRLVVENSAGARTTSTAAAIADLEALGYLIIGTEEYETTDYATDIIYTTKIVFRKGKVI